MTRGLDRPLAVDLYAGVGGLSLGLAQAGFDVQFAIEADSINARYLRFNHPRTAVVDAVVCPEITAIVSDAIPSGKEIVLLAGGPPCQGFSHAGLREEGDHRNQELGRFADAVIALAPMAFMMENVTGMLTHGARELSSALRHLATRYVVIDPEVINASWFGVPQARKRVFLLGIRKDLGVVPSVPVGDHAPPGTDCRGLPPTPTVSDAIDDLPVASGDDHEGAQGIPYDDEPDAAYARVMRGVVEDPADYSATVAWNGAFCTNAVATSHGKAVERRFSRLGFGELDPVSNLRRLDPDGLSVTIRAGSTKEYGSRSAPRPVHPHQDRVITTRECARIQSFPDWYLFHPTRWHGNRQVGNAVPPLMARAIGAHVLELLEIDSAPDQSEPVSRDVALIREDYSAAPWLPPLRGSHP